MVFEEFFKKKRIDLAALQQAEGSLFLEFKEHFEQMGEKSFDHTKKYWFNKLRRRFPISTEIKTERVHIANPLAEQTITESLIEPGTPSKIGFTPKFRAASSPKPAEEKPQEIKAAESEEAAAPKPGFKPRFNPGMVKAKPAEDSNVPTEKPELKEGEDSRDQPLTKPAFKPRFNTGMVKPKPAEPDEPGVAADPATPAETSPAPKVGFKPRFNAAMVKPKPVVEEEKPTEAKSAAEPVALAEEIPAPKIGFKPRFNAAVMKPQSEEEEKPTELTQPEVTAKPVAPTEETPAPKLGFKPRFNAQNNPAKTDSE
ncbi:hypothetical protein [Mucilaginibacter flavus]|uniref:hypothetical protein n=1 Tax=Mucilaginibacter flavus TaxID=931504 RepID=UPI0025B49061|nr:hypothetical protein [Mucilaginibacter flavus]MDN3583625.1 hypothetical protein [Mucilaginibacter flavus]